MSSRSASLRMLRMLARGARQRRAMPITGLDGRADELIELAPQGRAQGHAAANRSRLALHPQGQTYSTAARREHGCSASNKITPMRNFVPQSPTISKWLSSSYLPSCSCCNAAQGKLATSPAAMMSAPSVQTRSCTNIFLLQRQTRSISPQRRGQMRRARGKSMRSQPIARSSHQEPG